MRNHIHDRSNLHSKASRDERPSRGGGGLLHAATSAALLAGLAGGCLDEREPEAEPAAGDGAEDAAGLELAGEAAQAVAGDSAQLAPIQSSGLALLNGWAHAPFSTRSARVSLFAEGIVRFEGAIASGTHPVAFTLPSAYRPATSVFVPVDLCNAKKGRLIIQPSGDVSVQAEKLFSDAQCFTSLEGASFLLGTPSYKLALQNGWVHAAYGTRDAGVSASPEDVVRFRGAMGNGTSGVAFTLPLSYRPPANVYVPVDLSDARKGRLFIQPSGVVTVQTQGPFSDALFTSLEGVSFARSTAAFTTLALQSGWVHAPFGTRNAAVTNDAGIVRFAGAVAGSASAGPALFTLPSSLRPMNMIYIPIDLCGARKGRLIISPTGVVSVQAEGDFDDARCFTSLEGASFKL